MVDHARAEWSAYPNTYFSPMGTATGVAIHHTASAAHPASYDPEILRMIEQGEMNIGYNALAYHTMWHDDGSSAESRPYGRMGAATGGHNGDTMAHCAIGYFHPPYNHVPSDAMVKRIAAEIYQTRVDGFLTWDAPVLPHRDWVYGTQWATACCGDNFVGRVAEIDRLSRQAPGPVKPVQQEEDGNMWGVVCKLVDGRVEYLHGIGAIVQFSVIGQPDPWLGLPLNELNFVGYKFGGFPVKEVDAKAVKALRTATKALIGVEQANQLP